MRIQRLSAQMILYAAMAFVVANCAGAKANQVSVTETGSTSLFSQIGWTKQGASADFLAPAPQIATTGQPDADGRDARGAGTPTSRLGPTAQGAQAVDQPAMVIASSGNANAMLADFEAMALASNPAIAEAAARVEAAQGRLLQSGLGPNPEIGYSGQQLGSRGVAEQNGIVLSKKFIRGGKLELNRAVECEEVHRQNAALALQHQRVVTDVRIAFYNALAAQQRLALARQLADINAQALAAAESLVRAKEGSKVDVLQAQIELETVTAALHQAEFEVAGAWRRLASVVGQPDLPKQELTGEMETSEPILAFEDLWPQLNEMSPEIQLARIAVEKACRNLRRQQAEPISDVEIQTVLQYDNGTDGINGNVQVMFPLRIANRNQGGIQEATAQVTEARQALERKQLGLRAKLSDAFAQYETARDQVGHYRESILPKAAENLELVRRGYEAGEFSFIQVLVVQRTYSEKNSIYLTALRELWTRKLEIDGLLLKDSLSDF